MKNKNVQTDTIEAANPPKGSSKRGLAARLVLTAALSSGVTAMYLQNQEAADKAATAEATATEANDRAASAEFSAQAAHERIDVLQEEFAYATDVAGLDAEMIEQHMQLPEIPIVTEHISSELAAKQDAATMYLLSYDMHNADESTPSTFSCTVVKTGENKLTTAAHCFGNNLVVENYQNVDVPVKGGPGEYVEPDSFLSAAELYVANTPTMTLGEARQNAARITGFNSNAEDAAVLAVESTPEWFQSVEPLISRATAPMKGETVRVSGYPGASASPVTAEGIVLGTASASELGYLFGGNMTFVGIRPDEVGGDYERKACNFGGSGEAMMDSEGLGFGALSSVYRSDNPSDIVAPSESDKAAIPTLDRLTRLEDYFGVKLGGEKFVLCGFSNIPEMEVKPLITDPSQYVMEGK